MTRERGSCTPSGKRKRKRKTTTRSNNKRQCSGLSKKTKKNAQHLNPCSSSSVSISPRRQVDWLALPPEVMVLIFQRLGIVLTLTTAQLVCSRQGSYLLQNGNGLTNVGLQAIIDACPCLEYIFLGQCSNIDLEGDFFHKCVRKIPSIRIDLVKKEHEFRFEVGDHLQSQVWGYDLDFSDDEYSEIYVEHDLCSQDQ